VAVRTHESSQVRELRGHFDATADLDSTVLDELRTLAVQLDGCSVLPLIGAAGAFDCGTQTGTD